MLWGRKGNPDRGGGVCGSRGSHRSAGGVVRVKQTIGCGQRAQGGLVGVPGGCEGLSRGSRCHLRAASLLLGHKRGNAVGKWFCRGEPEGNRCGMGKIIILLIYFLLLYIIQGSPLLLSHLFRRISIFSTNPSELVSPLVREVGEVGESVCIINDLKSLL